MKQKTDDEEKTLRFKKVCRQLEKNSGITEEIISEVKSLFLSGKSAEEKQKAYMENMPEYEDLIFYSWGVPSLCDEATTFWDDVLESSDTYFTGNSVIRILIGRRPNENLLKVMQNHRDKFFNDACFGSVIKTLISRFLTEPGMFNIQTKTTENWTERELNILKQIVLLF